MLLTDRSGRVGHLPVVATLTALLLCGVAAGSCSGASDPSADAVPVTTDADARGRPRTTDTAALPTTPGLAWGIPELQITRLRPAPGDWRTLKVVDGRLIGHGRIADNQIRLARFDPSDGRVVVERILPPWDEWTFSDGHVVILQADRRTVTVLDPETLATTSEIVLPEDARASLDGSSRTGPFWIALQQSEADQLAGIHTRMAVARLDLDAGSVNEIRDVTACGATSVGQLDANRLAVAIACTYQFEILDPRSGVAQIFEGFPSIAHLLVVDAAVFLRWKTFGYLARLGPDDDRPQTLDLNVDGPTLGDLGGIQLGDGDLWVTGTPTEAQFQAVLTRVDARSFQVVARAWSPSRSAVFLDGTGYGITDDGLVRFDPSTVDGGRPERTVRPALGAPTAARPQTEDERAVVTSFTTVFDPSVPDDQAVTLLEDPVGTRDLRSRLIALAKAVYTGVEPVVTAIAVDGDEASVNYVFLLDGKVAFVPLSGSLRRQNGRWVVTRDSTCRLAAQAAVPGCP